MRTLFFCIFVLLIPSFSSATVLISETMANGVTYSFSYSDNNNNSILTSDELIDFTMSEDSGAGRIVLDLNDILTNNFSWSLNALGTGFDALSGEFHAKRTVSYNPGYESLKFTVDTIGLRWDYIHKNSGYIGYHPVDVIEAQVVASSVPEPSTLSIIGLGLISMFGVSRRKAQA